MGVMKEGSEMVSDTVTNVHANTVCGRHSECMCILHILHDKAGIKQPATCGDWHLREIYYVRKEAKEGLGMMNCNNYMHMYTAQKSFEMSGRKTRGCRGR